MDFYKLNKLWCSRTGNCAEILHFQRMQTKGDLERIFEEYEAVRNATIYVFNGFSEKALMRSGNQIGDINNRTIRVLAYHIAGH